MRQRVMIAMALALEPDVLIADEPTTALDVTIQAQILQLIDRLNRERDLAVILITHDLGVVAEIADRVLVMYAGQVVEDATLDEIFYEPKHPYTWGLLGSLARLDQPRTARLAQIPGAPPSLLAPPSGCRFAPRCSHVFDECTELPPLEARTGGDAPRPVLAGRRGEGAAMAKGDPLLEVTDLVKHFPIKSGIVIDREVARVRAVDGVSLTLNEGETLGLVGESGCGKSTLCRAILQLTTPTSGSVRFAGQELVGRSRRDLRVDAPPDADDLPGPVRLAESAQAGGPDRRRPTRAARAGQGRRVEAPGAGPARPRRPAAPSTTTGSRTSSPAGSASASASPAHLRCGPS